MSLLVKRWHTRRRAINETHPYHEIAPDLHPRYSSVGLLEVRDGSPVDKHIRPTPAGSPVVDELVFPAPGFALTLTLEVCSQSLERTKPHTAQKRPRSRKMAT